MTQRRRPPQDPCSSRRMVAKSATRAQQVRTQACPHNARREACHSPTYWLQQSPNENRVTIVRYDADYDTIASNTGNQHDG